MSRHANTRRPVDFLPPVVKRSPLGGPTFARPDMRREAVGAPRPAHGVYGRPMSDYEAMLAGQEHDALVAERANAESGTPRAARPASICGRPMVDARLMT